MYEVTYVKITFKRCPTLTLSVTRIRTLLLFITVARIPRVAMLGPVTHTDPAESNHPTRTPE